MLIDTQQSSGFVSDGYDLFTVTGAPTELQHKLCECFKDENVFVEVIDALFGIDNFPTEQDHKRAWHKADRHLIEDGKLWQLGGVTPTQCHTMYVFDSRTWNKPT